MGSGPTVVSFSGGLDSSLVLAAATTAARRHGLPDPVPISWRSADAPKSHETPWQEAVVRELGLHDWIRLQADDELDYVGPVAARVVARYGVCVPANVHLHEPLAAQARGGALLTGAGGDQLFGLWRWSPAADVFGRRTRARPRALRQAALASLPARARRTIARRRPSTWPAEVDWLRPVHARSHAQTVALERVSEPVTWQRRVPWQAGRHQLRSVTTVIDRVAADLDVRAAHPLLAPGVVGAVARAGGRLGFSNRAAALPALFPSLLPRAVAERHSKASFDEVLCRAPSMHAAEVWDGTGVDPELVDVVALKALWRAGEVRLHTAALLQQVTLQGPPGRSPPR